MRRFQVFILFVCLAVFYIGIVETISLSVDRGIVSDTNMKVGKDEYRNNDDHLYSFSDIELGALTEAYQHQRAHAPRLARTFGYDISSLLKTFFRNLSYRDEILTQHYSHVYCTSVTLPAGEPSCQYYIYGLRHIII